MKINSEMLEELKEKIFVSPIEDLKAVLGNSYLKEIITSGALRTGVILVTDKRVYFKGKSYKTSGKKLKSFYGEQIVDLKNVTGTGFQVKSSIWSLVLGIIFGILSIWYITNHIFISAKYFRLALLSKDFRFLLILTITFISIYFIKRKTMFEINYAGGSIYLNSSWYSKEEIQDFEKQLRRAKDQDASSHQIQEILIPSSSKIEKEPMDKIARLKECKDMLEGGILNEDEFETLKKQILAE